MNKPLALSLIIPAYNEERHLKACLDSIALQTTMPFEVVVVDNNSTDHTAEVAGAYSFVSVLREKKQGIVHARDAGFNAAKGDIIGRIDADSILPPDWVEQVLLFYKDPLHAKTAFTGGGYFYNIRAPRLNGWIQGQLAFRANRFVCGHYVLWGSNMAFTSKAWEAVRGSICKRTDVHEDLDLAIHLHEHAYKIDYQESLRVGVYLKRVWSGRDRLHEHMQLWPKTLHVHNYRRWWVGVVGNIFLWYVIQPIFFVVEFVARIFGRKSIQ